MNVKKLGIVMLVVSILNVGFVQNSVNGMGKPLPKPVPTSCPSDMLCW